MNNKKGHFDITTVFVSITIGIAAYLVADYHVWKKRKEMIFGGTTKKDLRVRK